MNPQVPAVGGSTDFYTIQVDFIAFDPSLFSLFDVSKIMAAVFSF